nr:unnamed protein product [Callosobruchus analis]
MHRDTTCGENLKRYDKLTKLSPLAKNLRATQNLSRTGIAFLKPTCIQTLSFMKENGIGVKSPFRVSQPEKSMVSALRRGGVPVFSLPIFKSREPKVLAKPMAGWSPILPAGNTVSPILIWPFKKRDFLQSDLPLELRGHLKRSQILPQTPSRASVSLIKCPFPIPPNEGLQDISPTVSFFSVCAPIRAAAAQASLPAWPPPTTITSYCFSRENFRLIVEDCSLFNRKGKFLSILVILRSNTTKTKNSLEENVQISKFNRRFWLSCLSFYNLSLIMTN